MNQELIDHEDVGAAIREGRPLRPARGYRILVAQGDLTFQQVVLRDPVPLGRQILTAIGLEATADRSLFAILESGDFEDVRLDEPFDLREHGAERFVVFESDRDYRLTLSGDQISWGKPLISGSILYGLAQVSDGYAVFLDVPGGTDRLVEPTELLDLAQPGVEKFLVVLKAPLTFEIVINSRPYTVDDKHVTFEQVVALAFPGHHEPNVRFTMTYRHAASRPHAGELSAGQSVVVKPSGSTFNVTRAVQS